MNQLYVGTIQGVKPPSTPGNINGYQHEYIVLVTGDNFTQIPCNNAFRIDKYGASDEYEDAVLEVGQKVLVECLKDFSQVVIVGAIRNSKTTMGGLGHFYRHRYRYITTYISDKGDHSITADGGPNAQVNQSSVVLDDSVGESIILDKASQTLTINANTLKVIVQGDATVQVGGACNLTAASLTAKISGGCSVEAASLTAKVSGDASVTAGGKISAQAPDVELGQTPAGMVVTTVTHPTDYVTGIPIIGVGTVKAGP